MKTIILPTDFSQNAWHAMQYAAQLFRKDPCKYILLNSYNIIPPSVEIIGMDYITPIKESSEEGLKNQLTKFKSLDHHNDTLIETFSCSGNLVNVINDRINDEKIDCIVMGTLGASGFSEFFFGSNTAIIVREINCPILCIPKDTPLETPENIVFSTDNHTISGKHTLSFLKEIALQYSSTVFILNIESIESENFSRANFEEQIHKYFKNVEHRFKTQCADNIELGIQDFTKENQVNMLVMLKRKHTFWERLFKQSNTKEMVFHTEIPLLVLHEPVDK